MSPSLITVEITENQHDLIITKPVSGLSLNGRIRVPGDKSISHRALMLGAIALGETQIQGLLLGEDPLSTASCFRAMGADISELNSEMVRVQGIGLGQLQEPVDVLNAGNSGTTLRLMLGLLAAHPGRLFVVTGDSSLRSRPMSRVVKPLQQMGGKNLGTTSWER
jgi:3-phosphoshikimate 1-carboxyvinyltransferase